MPIYHKDISTSRARGRVGKIRLGDKEEDARGQEHPTARPWFRFDPEDKGMLPALQTIFGPEPKVLKILLTSNDRELVFPHYLRRYGKSRNTGKSILICKGTAERDENGVPLPALMRLDLSTGEVLDDFPCDPDTCPDFLATKCRYVGSLSFVLWDFPTLRPWQIDTGSEISIRRINTRLDQLEEIEVFGGKGNIAGVPLVLTLGPVEVKRPEWRAPRTVYCMDLELDTALMLDPRWRDRAAEIGSHSLALTAPDDSEHPEGLFPRSEVLGADIAGERRQIAEDAGDVTPAEEETTTAPPGGSGLLPDDEFRAKLEKTYDELADKMPDAKEAMDILGLERRLCLAMIFKHIDEGGMFRRTAMLRELIMLIDKKNTGESIDSELEDLGYIMLPGEVSAEVESRRLAASQEVTKPAAQPAEPAHAEESSENVLDI